jgi:hypothetical protein
VSAQLQALAVHGLVVLGGIAAFVVLVLSGHNDESYAALTAAVGWAGGAAAQKASGGT